MITVAAAIKAKTISIPILLIPPPSSPLSEIELYPRMMRWTTGSGMEGPPAPAGSDMGRVSTFPWPLFTKSPRRRTRVAFTCNVCGQRTTRAVNPHAYTDGTVFVQCNVDSSFNPNPNKDASFNYFDSEDDKNDHIFPFF